MLQAIFLQVLKMSAVSAVVCALVLALRFVLKRAPKKYTFFLWLVVFVRLCVPLYIPSSYSPIQPPRLVQQAYGAYEALPQRETPAPAPPVQQAQPQTPQTPAQPGPQIITAGQRVLAVLPAVWLGGVLAMLAYYLAANWLLRRSLRAATLAGQGIWVSKNLRSPLLVGVLRPRIYLPEGLPSQDAAYVLLHERTHLAHGDHFTKPLAYLVLCAHWFNPFAWLAFRFLCRDMEMWCDEAVLERLPGPAKKEYSSLLLQFAQQPAPQLAAPVAFGEHSAKARIKNILRFKKPALWLTALCVLLVGALSVLLMSQNSSPEQKTNLDLIHGKALQPQTAYTFTTIEEVVLLYEKGYLTETGADLLLSLLGQSHLPGFESQPSYPELFISRFALTATPQRMQSEYTFDLDFTVERSGYAALPPGDYQKELFSGAFAELRDRGGNGKSIYTAARSSIQRVVEFITSGYVWNSPNYGQINQYGSVVNYLVNTYGNGGELPLSEFTLYAEDIFGAYNIDPLTLGGLVVERDGIYYVQAGGIGGAGPCMELEDYSGDGQETPIETIQIRFYADRAQILPSHLVEYQLQSERFLSCTLLETGTYPPIGLQEAVYLDITPTVYTSAQQLDGEDYYEGFLKALLTGDVGALYRVYGFKPRTIDALLTVEIDPASIYIERDFYSNFVVDFTVTRSAMNTLPVGPHHYEIKEGMGGLWFETVAPREVTTAYPEAMRALKQFINYSSDEMLLLPRTGGDSMTSLYVLLALTEKYPQQPDFTAQEMADYAKTYLGMDSFELVEELLDKKENGHYIMPARGGMFAEHVIVSEAAQPDGALAFEVQFFADRYGLVTADRITYYLRSTEGGYVFERAEAAQPRSPWSPDRWSV